MNQLGKNQVFLIILAVVLAVSTMPSEAQNLVPNGDFEQYSSCPTSIGQLNKALHWFNPAPQIPPSGGSPDYFNSCDTTGQANVPYTPWGYQTARSGVGLAHFLLREVFPSGAREYIEVQLTDSLKQDSCYRFEMYINLSHKNYTSDAIGVYFSKTIISNVTNWNHLPYITQISNTAGNYPDTLNWLLVSGDYMASGGEQFIVIGNFSNDASTSMIQVNNLPPIPGYQCAAVMIDDVSLVALSTCLSSIDEIDDQQANIYPNPTTGHLTIESDLINIQSLIVRTIDGRIVLSRSVGFVRSHSLDLQRLGSGIYLLEIHSDRSVYYQKVILNNQ